MPDGLLPVRELQCAFVALCFLLEADANGSDVWPLKHELVAQRDCRTDGGDLRVVAENGEEMRFGLPRWFRQHFTNKAINAHLEMRGALLRHLHVGQPAKAKVGV